MKFNNNNNRHKAKNKIETGFWQPAKIRQHIADDDVKDCSKRYFNLSLNRKQFLFKLIYYDVEDEICN